MSCCFEGENPNVRKSYWYTLLGGCARGVWSFSVLSGYLYVLSNGSNWSVGLAEGIQGGAQAFVAIFGGVLADSWRRDRVLGLAGIVGLIAVAVTIFTVNVYLFGVNNFQIEYLCLCVALTFWGAYQGLWNTGLETIFADSIPKNQRSKPTTNKYILQLLATITGPVIAIFLFLGFGDKWQMTELRTVMIVGAGLCAPPAVLLFWFDDNDMVRSRRPSRAPRLHASTAVIEIKGGSDDKDQLMRYPEEAKGYPATERDDFNPYSQRQSVEYINEYRGGHPHNQTVSKIILPTGNFDLWSSPPHSPRDSFHGEDGYISVADQPSNADALGGPGDAERSVTERTSGVLDDSPRAKRVPYVTIVADILSGFGSGMTVKFFPLYFKNELHLSPIKVNAIYVGLPLAMAIGSQFAQILRRRIGRAQTCVLFGYIGALALLAMSQIDRFEKLETWYVLVPIYIFSSASHCTRPLKKSILMDYVPKSTRARWNSIDSITRFGWSGSAVVGGFLVDHYSYGATFLITSIMQLIAASLFLFLIPIVKIEPSRSQQNMAKGPSPRPTRKQNQRVGMHTEGVDAPLIKESEKPDDSLSINSPAPATTENSNDTGGNANVRVGM